MRVSRSAFTAAAALVLVPLSSLALDLQLKPVQMTYGKFEFTKIDDFPVDHAPPAADSIAASTQRHRVWIDPGEIRQAPGGYFKYEIYVSDRTIQTPSVIKFVFQGSPEGSFDDRNVSVAFELTTDEGVEQGSIRLPIYGKVAPDALSSPAVTAAIEVFMASDKIFSLPLKNELETMEIEVVSASATSFDKSLWREVTVETSPHLQLDPQKGAADGVRIRLAPRPFAALASALVPHGKDKKDDLIRIVIDYQIRGRRQQRYSIDVPVRFIPWPPTLFLTAVAGACIGTLVPPATRRRKWRDFSRALGTAAIVALILEAIAMVLVAADSQFRLFGFELDPFQMLPATLLGILVGMSGFKGLEALREFWNRRGGGSGSHAAAAAPSGAMGGSGG